MATCWGSSNWSTPWANRASGTEDIPILKSLADYAAIALENARYVQRIHELTITDDCTALYNARHLNFVLDTEIYRSNRYGYEFSVIFIDLDHFKQVNDVHGHLVGSKLLWMIGDGIKAHLRMIDYAFRYGGDEFVVLLPQTSKENALMVVRRVRDLLINRVFFRGRENEYQSHRQLWRRLLPRGWPHPQGTPAQSG